MRALLGLLFAATAFAPFALPAGPSFVRPPACGDAVVRNRAGGSEIVVTTTSRLAGAVHSLTWGGREFIDSADHGRQLQSAASFDGARPGEFWAECFNPTEAGSRADGAGPRSSSRLLEMRAEGAELRSRTRMAFWLAPGERSGGRPALNREVLSRHVVSKRVRVGYKTLPHVVECEVAFAVPEGEPHRLAQFEALTGYMPEGFSRFRTLDLATGALGPLGDGPGEQALPVVFAEEGGRYAMGVYSPDQPSRGFEKAGYGRFRFSAERVVKWNCVFRRRGPGGVPAGEYRFRVFVAVGTLEDVRRSLSALGAESAGH